MDNEMENQGLLINVYNSSLGNASNGGISSQNENLILVGENIPKIFKASKRLPVVYIKERSIGGQTYLTAYPIDNKEKSKGYMFGGTFVYSSDSRFPYKYPVPLHDRLE